MAQFSGATSGDVTSGETAIDIFNTAAAADLGLLAITTSTFFCSSTDPQNIDTGNGSVTITTDDQDPVGRSTGDSVTTTFNQCNQFGSVISGSTANKINALSGDPAVAGPWVVDTTHTTDLPSLFEHLLGKGRVALQTRPAWQRPPPASSRRNRQSI